MAKLLAPSLWANWKPLGLGETKPHHFTEMAKTAWQNKRHPLYAWRLLTRGVCDGCALGTSGMRDWTMDGIHLCTIRLNLLQLNTMGAMPWQRLETDLDGLRRLSSAELRRLGRLPYPMVRQGGDAGFGRVSWDEALDLLAERIRQMDPQRMAFYLTSRGLTNEVYYVAQKAARYLGTNHVDNAARVCHSPSSVALKQTLGVGASSVSYKDWIGTDLLVFIGSNVANNQPVTTKYLYYAKKAGTRLAVINPYKEPGMQRYWVPSVPESALMGTRLADEFYQVATGGDVAFLNGTLKYLIERDWLDHEFIARHTTGWDALGETLAAQNWETLERLSGLPREQMLAFAETLHAAKTGILVWSMGITQHAFGVQNVQAIVNIALSQGWLGKEHCGVVPIRGHSGVQGGAEVGAVPDSFPGGAPVDAESAAAVGQQSCEWEIFQDLGARVRPEQRDTITFASAQAIRDEIARVVPSYTGIERLHATGDQVQYGGRVLYRDGQFKTADGKGHFTALTPPELSLPAGKLMLSTRRGKQFNSLIYASKDAVTGARRDALFIAAEDAAARGLAEGDRALVTSDNGASLECRVHIAHILPRNVQVFWPEGNVLIRRRVCDVAAGVPDFNAIVEVAPLAGQRALLGVSGGAVDPTKPTG